MGAAYGTSVSLAVVVGTSKKYAAEPVGSVNHHRWSVKSALVCDSGIMPGKIKITTTTAPCVLVAPTMGLTEPAWDCLTACYVQ